MRVPTTTATGPVASFTQDEIDTEFSHIIWTNFSGQLTTKDATKQLSDDLVTGSVPADMGGAEGVIPQDIPD